MDQHAYRIVGTAGTIIGAISVVDFSKGNLWINISLILVVGYSAIFFAVDTCRAIANRPRAFNRTTEGGKRQIAEHLVAKLSSGGRVAIFSRDLTWVEKGSPAETLLLDKAQKDELSLFIKRHTELTERLKSQGADVRIYPAKHLNPKSRFTILDYQNSGTRVMVGAPNADKHIIKHYGRDDHEVVDLATDFIEFLSVSAKKQR